MVEEMILKVDILSKKLEERALWTIRAIRYSMFEEYRSKGEEEIRNVRKTQQGRGLVFSPTFKTDLIVRFPRSPMYHKQAEKDLDDQIEEYLRKANTSKGGELDKFL